MLSVFMSIEGFLGFSHWEKEKKSSGSRLISPRWWKNYSGLYFIKI